MKIVIICFMIVLAFPLCTMSYNNDEFFILNTAVELTGQIQEPEHQAIAYYEIAKIFAQDDEFDKARQLSKKALEVLETVHDNYESNMIRAEIIQTLMIAGAFDIVAEQLQKIEIEQLKNSLIESNARTLLKDQKVEAALELIKFFDDERLKSRLFSTAAIAYAKSGEFEKAKNLSEDLKPQFLKDFCLTRIFIEMYKVGKADEAKELLKQVDSEQAMVEPIMQAVDSLSRKGNFAKALGLIDFLQQKRDIDMAKMTIVRHLAVHGELEETKKIVEEINYDFAKNNSLKAIALAMMDTGKLEQANKAIFKINQPNQQSRALEMLSRKYHDKGDIDQSILAAKSIPVVIIAIDNLANIAIKLMSENPQKANEVSNIYRQIIAEQSKSDQDSIHRHLTDIFVEAQMLDKAFETVSAIKGKEHANMALASIARRLASSQKSKMAIETIKKISDPRRMPNSIREVVRHVIEKDILKEIEELVKTTDMRYPKNNLLNLVASRYALNGHHKEAKRLAQSLENENEQQRILAQIASSYAKNNDFDKAISILKSVTIDNVKNREIDAISFSLARNKKFGESLKFIRLIDNERHFNNALITFIEICINNKNVEYALEAASLLNNVRDMVPAYGIIASYYVHNSKLPKAVKLVERIDDPSGRAYILAHIHKAYRSQNLTAEPEERKLIRNLLNH